MGLELLKALAVLVIMLAGLYFLLKLLKQKMVPHKGMVEMLHYQSFGPKKGIAVIKIANDYMAVGIADQSISLLSKLDGESVEQELKLQKPEDMTQGIKSIKSIWQRTKS